jgi:two-component system phosphate regulon response regulator PhoB
MARESVLVVDDERDILELVKYNLDKEGYQVTVVATGEDALAAACTQMPDIVILDLMLQGVDGLEICRSLKGDPKTRGIPVVMLTAKGDAADVVNGLELGASDYVTKPFSPRVLTARIRAVLRRAHEADDDETMMGIDGARSGRLAGDGFGPAMHLGAGGRRPVGYGVREERRPVQMTVVGEEEGADDLTT